MASEIMNHDLHVATQMAWHGLTKVKDSITRDDFLPLELRRLIAMPTTAQVDELIRSGSLTSESLVKFLESRACGYSMPAIASTDNLIGVPVNPETYTVRDIAHLFDSIDNCGLPDGYKVVSAGTYGNRTKYAISIELPNLNSVTVGGREFKLYLTLTGSLDKTRPETWGISTTCVVCANTLAIALREMEKATTDVDLSNGKGKKGKKGKEVSEDFRPVDGARLFARMRHSRNMADKVAAAEVLVNSVVGTGHLFKSQLNDLLARPVRADEARAIYTGFLENLHVLPEQEFASLQAAPDGLEISTRRRNEVDEMTSLFSRGLGNKGENGLDLLSGFTERYSRRDGLDAGARAKFVSSSEAGVYAERKSEFFAMLLDKPLTETCYTRGRIALDRSGVDGASQGIGDVMAGLMAGNVKARSLGHAS